MSITLTLPCGHVNEYEDATNECNFTLSPDFKEYYVKWCNIDYRYIVSLITRIIIIMAIFALIIIPIYPLIELPKVNSWDGIRIY